jgi:predicted O-methyltransferase YrrM
MRTFRHWTPRYISDRIAAILYRSRYPDRPWLTPTANEILTSFIRESDVGLEFGSGNITIWFAKRVRHLTSVEHNDSWYNHVHQILKDESYDNVAYHLMPRDKEDTEGDDSAYVRQIDGFSPNSIDFVLVDGIYRDFCVLGVLPLIRPGGILIIDNVNKYLPSDSRSPNSRSHQAGPNGETWVKAHQALHSWRTIWTSSGVWDTAIYIRPCDSSQAVGSSI